MVSRIPAAFRNDGVQFPEDRISMHKLAPVLTVGDAILSHVDGGGEPGAFCDDGREQVGLGFGTSRVSDLVKQVEVNPE